MPIIPAEYENGREGAFILGSLIPFINALEERIGSLESQHETSASNLALIKQLESNVSRLYVKESPIPSVTKPTIKKPKKVSSK